MRCAVLGDPIAHSLSPALHRAGYAALGLDWSYEAVRVAAGELEGFLAGLDEADGWRGLSLTMPLKREVLALPGVRATERVRLSGAANTVVLGGVSADAGCGTDAGSGDGNGARLLLDNTDLPGAAAALRERWVGEVGSVTILGGGATAASVGLAMCDLGAREVRVLVRSAERAAETVAAITAHPSAPDVRIDDLARGGTGGCDVVVSTVPAGAQTPSLVGSVETATVVFEVLYDPWPTPLAAAVQAHGGVLVGGLDLLVHQAALQFELFTGHGAPLAAMREAGERELSGRLPA